MTATPRPRPSATMTQVVRPTCEIYGAPELHSYIGPGINSFGSPCLMRGEGALWWSDGTAWDTEGSTSKKSTTVFAANDALLMQGGKAKGRRHHLVFVVGVSLFPPAPVALAGHTPFHVPGEWIDPIDQDKGKSIAIFAPRHVKADIDGQHEVATLRIPGGSAMGVGNFSVCCDPADHFGTFASQTPNTVFLGMTMADTIGAIIAWNITNLANTILKLLVEAAISRVSRRLAEYISRQIGRAANVVVREALQAARNLGGRWFAPIAKRAAKKGIAAAFDMPDGRFDHTNIDDGIADLWDEYVVSP